MREAELRNALEQTTKFTERQQLLKALWKLRQETAVATSNGETVRNNPPARTS